MRVALLLWPDTFEDWYEKLGIDRRTYLDRYEEEWSTSVARALVAAGVDLHLVLGTLEDEQTATHRPSGATVHFVRAAWAYRALRRAVWGHRHWERTQRLWPAAPVASTASPRLLRALRAIRPDIVLVQDYETPRYDVMALLCGPAGLRIAALDAGSSAMPSSAPWKRWTLRRARLLLAVHEAEAARALAVRGRPPVVAWPVPVRTDLLGPGDRPAARERLGLDPRARLVLSVGRLHEVKNLPGLADATAGLDCELLLVGSGPERDALEARRDPHVRLVGRVAPDDLADWYAAADVVALASNQEGQPVAVLEGLTCGRGVVATAVGGVPDVIADGETGWLVRPRDTEALRDALRDALADREEADRRGAAGRARVVERHASDAVGRFLADALSRAAR